MTAQVSAPADNEVLLNRAEAAKYCRKTKASLAQLAYNGKGPKYLKPTTRSVLYRKSDLDAWLNGSEVDPTQP